MVLKRPTLALIRVFSALVHDDWISPPSSPHVRRYHLDVGLYVYTSSLD